MEIVEEFVVTLGLDPSKYKRESQAFKDDLKQLKETAGRDARDVESSNRRMAESFSRVKNEIIGLALTVASARSVGGLVQDMIHGAAETGRFGQAIGMATEKVSVWEMAVQSMGGSAQDARSALAALNSEYTSYMLTGRAVHDADLNAMGIRANDLQSPEGLAMALAERRNNMTQREFTARLQRMGLPDSFIRTLAQGRRGVEDLLGQMERVGPVTDRDARAAIEFERQWSILTNRLRSDLRPVLTWLVETALPWIIEHGPQVAAAMGVGIAGGVTLMTLALVRASGPLGVVVAGLTAIVALASQIRDMDQVGGAFHDMYLRVREGALRGELEAFDRDNPIQRDAAGNPAITPENRDRMARRQEILNQISDLAGQREGLSRRVHGDNATPSAGGAGWWPGGGHAGPGGVLARVRATESGNNYNRVVYDAARPPRPLTSMSMGDVYDWQIHTLRPLTRGRGTTERARRIGSTGVGAYQFESGTMATMAAQEFGAGWRDVIFSNATQDRLASRLHGQQGTRPWAIGQRGGAGTAMRSGRGGGSSQVSVGSVVVYVPPGTPRQQAERVADEIPRAVQRRGVVTQANKGLN